MNNDKLKKKKQRKLINLKKNTLLRQRTLFLGTRQQHYYETSIHTITNKLLITIVITF